MTDLPIPSPLIPMEFDRSIDALSEVFQYLDAELGAAGVDPPTLLQLHLVAEEIFTNMVRHSRGEENRISVCAEKVGTRIVLKITDYDADPFDPDSVGEVDTSRPIEEREAGGLGLHLVRSIVDQLSYESVGRRMTVTAVKNLES